MNQQLVVRKTYSFIEETNSVGGRADEVAHCERSRCAPSSPTRTLVWGTS